MSGSDTADCPICCDTGKVVEMTEKPCSACRSQKTPSFSPSKSSEVKNAALREIEMHNDVTMTIVVGLLLDNADIPVTAVAVKIMKLFKRRGYEPQILACNRLLDGTNV
ncbi:MAG: hypothetical protein WCZ86_03950 [Desulfurivibrionaceae bacterium]|jgi:hypothetical protein